MKALGKLLLLILVGYLGAVAWLYFNQRNILFLPDHTRKSDHGFYMTADSGDKIWITTYNEGKPKALLYFPGNTENDWDYPERIAHNLPTHTVYFMHYRSFGKSEGEPSQDGFYADALKLFDTVAPKHQQVDIMGRSLGSGMAVYTAANKKADKMVLVTPYDGIANLAKKSYPWMPISLVLKDPFPSASYAPKIDEKTLVLLSEHDTKIPYSSSKILIGAMKNKPEVITLRGVSHSASIRHPLYLRTLRDFLEK